MPKEIGLYVHGLGARPVVTTHGLEGRYRISVQWIESGQQIQKGKGLIVPQTKSAPTLNYAQDVGRGKNGLCFTCILDAASSSIATNHLPLSRYVISFFGIPCCNVGDSYERRSKVCRRLSFMQPIQSSYVLMLPTPN